jgi:hypothetical protein
MTPPCYYQRKKQNVDIKDMGCKKKGSFHQLVGCAGGVSHTLT